MATKDQRRRQLAREKFERQQQRRAQRRTAARRRNAVMAGVVAVVVAAGAAAYASTGLADKKQTSAAPSKAPAPCAQPAPGAPGSKQWKTEPAMDLGQKTSYTMTLDTTCGTIALTLDGAAAPHTVNSFRFLAAQGFFDHTKCHRLTTSGIYVLQCGDPKGSGMGGPGYKLPDENLKAASIAKGTYPAGTVAMANSGPNTGGSQFFLVYRDSKLPASYTPFGTIGGDGMKVLQKIAAAGSQPADAAGNTAPNATVVINKATVAAS